MDGADVTPATVRLPTGDIGPVHTGELEEHIVADVAWSAAYYLDWTGDVTDSVLLAVADNVTIGAGETERYTLTGVITGTVVPR